MIHQAWVPFTIIATFTATVTLLASVSNALDKKNVDRGILCVDTDCYRLTKIDGARP